MKWLSRLQKFTLPNSADSGCACKQKSEESLAAQGAEGQWLHPLWYISWKAEALMGTEARSLQQRQLGPFSKLCRVPLSHFPAPPLPKRWGGAQESMFSEHKLFF